jgi:diadenosine tetraphosphate (Ap4A) HIT family hydrolase
MDGNLMIISKRHVEDINGMNDLERTEFFEVLEKTKKKLSKIFETDDFNIGLNIGKKAGASIKHLHWQVIPRREKILNASNVFGDLYVITVSPRELKKMIDKK